MGREELHRKALEREASTRRCVSVSQSQPSLWRATGAGAAACSPKTSCRRSVLRLRVPSSRSGWCCGRWRGTRSCCARSCACTRSCWRPCCRSCERQAGLLLCGGQLPAKTPTRNPGMETRVRVLCPRRGLAPGSREQPRPPTSAASSPSRADRGLAPAKARNGGSVPGAPTPHGLPAAALCTLWASAVTRLISDGVPPSPQRSPTLALARSWPPHPQDSRGAPVAPQTREASPIWPRQASRGAPVDPPIQPLNNTTRRSPANRVGLAPRNSPKSA